MGNKKTLLDNSGELLIQRWNNGVKLMNPDILQRNQFIKNNSYHTVNSILKFPINVYFLNTESIMQNTNDASVKAFGTESIKDLIGKSVRNIIDPEAANLIINHDNEVLKIKKMKIIEEYIIKKSCDFNVNVISIKFPWYNNDNTVIGVFGFAIVTDMSNGYSLAESLELISKTGLLNTENSSSAPTPKFPGTNINGTYISKRESECLYYTSRGFTAKTIAKILKLSPRTVEYYLENVKIKMNISSKSEMTEKFLEHLSFIAREKI